jgi:PAS domain S-box-containing protein
MKPIESCGAGILRELMDCVDSLVLVADGELRVVEANRAASMFFGYPASELASKGLQSLIAKEDRLRVARLCKSARDRRGCDAVLVTRQKKRAPARLSVSPVRGAQGGLRLLVVVMRPSGSARPGTGDDPTNGLAERMLKGFADPMFIVDGRSRTISDCNGAAVATFGFSRRELVGRRLLDRFSLPEPAPRGRSIEAKADHNYATAGIFQERVLFPRGDGTPLPCDLVGLPFFGRDGSLSLIIAMLFDRSSEEAREAELSEVVERVRGLSSELAALTAGPASRARSKRLSDFGLTPRQVDIARLCASGSPSKEIGYELGIAESTVKNHLAEVYRKLGVHSRMGLARSISARRLRLE